MLSIRKIEIVTGYSVADWPGACGVICNRILDAELVDGKMKKGRWTGVTNYDSEIAKLWLSDDDFLQQKQPRHCWIILNNGKILDPTRWVFEGIKPYIYCGINDCYLPSAQEMVLTA